jgi:hypothetical protein
MSLCTPRAASQRLYPGRLTLLALSSMWPPAETPALEALMAWLASVKAARLKRAGGRKGG